MWQQGTSTVSQSVAGKLLSIAERECHAGDGKAAAPGRLLGAGSLCREHRLSDLSGMVRIAAATPESARQDWWALGTQITLSLDKAAAVLPR